jgi:hypothetical protein
VSTSMGGRVRRASNFPSLNAQAPVAKLRVCMAHKFKRIAKIATLFKSGQKMQKGKPHCSELHRKRDSSSFHHCSIHYFSHNSGKSDNLNHLRKLLLACTMVSFSNMKLLGLFFFGASTQLVSSRLYQQTILETEEQVWTRHGMDLHFALFFPAKSCSHTIMFHVFAHSIFGARSMRASWVLVPTILFLRSSRVSPPRRRAATLVLDRTTRFRIPISW